MKRKVELLGVPLNMGSQFRAVSLGPQKLRERGLLETLRAVGIEIKDNGDIAIVNQQEEAGVESTARYAEEIACACKLISEEVAATLERNTIPFIIGGDHSMSMGTVAGVARHYQKQNKKIGVIWFDAHGDSNTPESSLSGNIHGMPVAHLIGLGLPKLRNISGFSPAVEARNFILIGVRDLDEAEKRIIEENNIFVATSNEIKELGIERVLRAAFLRMDKDLAGIHVSFDLDCLDPLEAPGVSLAVRDGLTLTQALRALEIIKTDQKLLSFEVAELNPEFDSDSVTASHAISLAVAALK